MTTTHPEDAGRLTGVPTAWQPHPPEQPYPAGWAEAGEYAWYPYAPQAQHPAPHLAGLHVPADPYQSAAPVPGWQPGAWPAEESWNAGGTPGHALAQQGHVPIPQAPEWPGWSDSYASPEPAQPRQPHDWYVHEHLQPPAAYAWYAQPPPQPQDVQYAQAAYAHAPVPHPDARPHVTGEDRDSFTTLPPPEPVLDAEQEAPGPAPLPSGRAGSRRAAASAGAGSGRRRAARGRAGSGRRRKRPVSGIAARAASTVMVTSGLAMVLFVVHQVWWSNVQARAEADDARAQLEQAWNEDPGAGAGERGGTDGFAPGEGFAVIRIPKLGLDFPIAEGIGRQEVLDRGLVGHYPGTGMPADTAGNFVLAAHRNTHGEPFREIGRLEPGDRILVDTASATYTYEVAGRIPETPPSDVSVLRPIPGGAPFSVSGRYITLTTCTPEYSTRGRLIVFGELVEERPRGQA
ncbi:class E sortase [Streptomyces cyaneofuscatus]|uniref:class E sortase n=1 Tax=Streptomyces cyaneofuscatus TaxID=66883 RepID=UPI0033E27E57